jgi:hypothetical protein
VRALFEYPLAHFTTVRSPARPIDQFAQEKSFAPCPEIIFFQTMVVLNYDPQIRKIFPSIEF